MLSFRIRIGLYLYNVPAALSYVNHDVSFHSVSDPFQVLRLLPRFLIL